MMNQPILEIQNLSVHRAGSTILDNISWKVHLRENWVILGANGSGKTSLLKTLLGYLMPSTGTITVLGEAFGHSDWRELRKIIGIVSSSIANMIHPEDTGLEIVVGGKSATIGTWGCMNKTEKSHALNLLESVGAAHLASKTWLIFSQGERQRVLIARALMANPKILILDEPCAGLDPVAREKFLIFLTQHSSTHPIPLLFVTLHVEEIIPCLTHALILKIGRILAACPISQLNSAILSDAFSCPITLSRKKRRFTLTIEHTHI